MRHVTTLLVVLLFAWVAGGAPGYLHAQHHARTQKTGAAWKFYQGNSTHLPNEGREAPSNEPCVQCLVLHSPQVAGNAPVLLIASGEWVPFVSMQAVSQQSQTFPGRFSCRGPPVEC